METTTKSENPADEIERPRRAERLKAGLAVLLLCAGLSAIAVVPFFFMGRLEDGKSATGLRMPTTHDMFLHYDQMKSFYAGLSAGEAYPRWEEDTNRGFGAPTTSYYPPGVYYLTAASYAVSGDWVKALLWSQLLMMMASAGAIYLYARRVMSRAAAMVAVVAYVVGPYHLIDQYQRGAIAELMGFVFMPLILWGVEELIEGGRGERVRGGEGGEGGEGGRWGQVRREVMAVSVIGASYGGFVWSHPPTAYQYSLGLGVYVILMGLMRREWKGLVKAGLGIMLGVGLSAAYIIPAAVDQDLIRKEYITSTWPYHNTYVFVHDLFNYNSLIDFFQRINAMWVIGSLVIIAAGIALLMFKREAAGPCPRLRQRVVLWIMLGCFASFMMHKISRPVGELIPKIEIGVFTWRMLSVTTLVVALLAGACAQVAIQAVKERRRETLAICGSLCVLILVGSAAFSALFVVAPVSQAQVFVPEEEHLNSATVPSAAPGIPEELPDDIPPAELAEDNGEAVVEQWNPEHRVIKVQLEDADQLLIRTFNFPGWTATVDGHPAQITTGEELGDIQIDLEAGAHEVRLDFLDTPIQRKSEMVTIATFFLLLAMSVASLFRRGQRAGRTH